MWGQCDIMIHEYADDEFRPCRAEVDNSDVSSPPSSAANLGLRDPRTAF